MNPDLEAIPFRASDPVDSPLAGVTCAQDVLEVMLRSIEGGELHVRPPLVPSADSPFLTFIEIGLALRQCLEDPHRRDYLIARLRPHLNVIIGVLPAGIQPHGMLPKSADRYQQEFGFRSLEQISDDEVRQWIIDDGRLIYGEFKRHELENYVDVIARVLPPGGTMIDMGSGLGKVVLSAALLLPFERCIGVELLPYRHQMAQARLEKMLAARNAALAALPEPLSPDATLNLPGGGTQARHLLEVASRIALIERDMFDLDTSDASLVFIYSTCFAPLMRAIADKLAREMREGSLVSSTTYAIHHPGFRLIKQFPSHTLAWTNVFLYERVGAPGSFGALGQASVYEPDQVVWEEQVREAFASFDGA